MRTKKKLVSEEEIAHDPSLRWYSTYHYPEQVFSEVHNEMVRFVEYVGTSARVATMNGIATLPELVPLLKLRRP